MKHARPLLLAASALSLLISACSQPADIQTPGLEPQFGTVDDDIGVDVAVPSADSVYVLSDQSAPWCDDGEPKNQRVMLRRYDSQGTLTLTKEVTTQPLDYDCTDLRALLVKADTQGNTYTLVAHQGVSQDVFEYNAYSLFKHSASGDQLRRTRIGTNFWNPYAEESEADHKNAIDMAVDGGGNIYIVFESGELNDDYESFNRTNLVVKYAANGVKQWQRLSTVGTPYGVTVSGSGSVYVVGTRGLARYANDGKLTWSRAADNSKGHLANAGEVVISGSNLYTRSVKTIRKYDGSGRQLWVKAQGGLNTIVVQDMTGDASGNLYLSGKYQASSGNMSAFARKLNSSGSVLWTKTYGTPEYDDALGIATLGSAVYTTGETQGSLAHPNRGGGYYNRDGYVRKFSSSGSALWTR